jgi:RhtB (resistance to homoserine/threonine) family protein
MNGFLGTHDLALFVLSGLLLNIAPGPDTLYILGRSATQGWRGGSVAALGITAGCCVHIVAAALGLSALLAASATAFTLLKWIGGAYLVWIGISMLRTRTADADSQTALPPQTLRRVFAQGFATNALNPKVALFFLAFLPQFIDPNAPHKALAFLFLGCVFNFNSVFWNLFVAWSAARLADGVVRSNTIRAWLNRAIGGVLVVLGIRLAAVTS